MPGLTPEQIEALLGKTRTKGAYAKYLADFIESGEEGVEVGEQWADLKGKKDTTVKQGFENAKNHKDAPAGADMVKVISNEGSVYLLNLALLAGSTEEAA